MVENKKNKKAFFVKYHLTFNKIIDEEQTKIFSYLHSNNFLMLVKTKRLNIRKQKS